MIVNHLGSVLAPFASEFNCVSWFYSIELKEFQQQQQQKDKNKNKTTLLLKDIIGGWEVFLLDCRLSLDLFLWDEIKLHTLSGLPARTRLLSSVLGKQKWIKD